MDLSDMLGPMRQQQRHWAGLSIAGRLRPLRHFRRLLCTECDTLCDAVRRDIGKAPDETLATEILPLADAMRFLERQAPRLLRPRKVGRAPLWLMGQRDVVHRRPRGIVAIIGTWNYPAYLNGIQIAQALTAGNAVLWKPSEVAPATAEVLGGLLRQAGYPPDLMETLPATREAGPAVAEADVDHVVFTGSAAIGRKLAARLGERLVSSTLELSGCDAMFVLDDADLNLAVPAAWLGCTLNRGQTCIAVRRVFVQRPLYRPFVEALRPLVAHAKPVRLVQPGQVAHARRLVEQAVAAGAELLSPPAPETRDDPHLCPPSVLLDARPEMEVCRVDAFAPVTAVLPFDSVEQSLAMEAQCPYALGASVFTKEQARADEMIPRLRTGFVIVNDVIVGSAHPETPFGGTGASGWGVTQGAEGLLEMTVPQVHSYRGGTYRPHFPMTDGKGGGQGPLLRALMEWSHAPTLGRRLAGMYHTIREAARMR